MKTNEAVAMDRERVAYERSHLLQAKVADSRVKRVLDFLLSLCAILFLAPGLALIALAIRLDSPGPILFRQRRSGLNGQLFEILKFRSMTCLEDGETVIQARPGDVRVTRVGRFLRRTSLDELPQLYNIFRGEMSFVGPRPHALSHDRQFAAQIIDYDRRFETRPGLTGLAQVRGYRGEIRTHDDLKHRIEADIEYIDTWSPLKDVKILLTTSKVLFGHKNAY